MMMVVRIYLAISFAEMELGNNFFLIQGDKILKEPGKYHRYDEKLLEAHKKLHGNTLLARIYLNLVFRRAVTVSH